MAYPGFPSNCYSHPNFDDFARQNRTFASLAGYQFGQASVSGGSEPVRMNIASVSSGFFSTIGSEPVRGRPFAPEEQRLHGSPAVIVSYIATGSDISGEAAISPNFT
jgi:putative ABC transport system permease protein